MFLNNVSFARKQLICSCSHQQRHQIKKGQGHQASRPDVIKWQTSQRFDELIDFAAHPVLHSIFLNDLDNLEEFFIIKNPTLSEPKVNYLNDHHLEQILDQIPGVISLSPVAKGRMFKHPNASQVITQSPSITITANRSKNAPKITLHLEPVTSESSKSGAFNPTVQISISSFNIHQIGDTSILNAVAESLLDDGNTIIEAKWDSIRGVNLNRAKVSIWFK